MKRPTGMARVFEAALNWHAATFLSGQRQSPADKMLHQSVCRYFKQRADRAQRHNRRAR